MRCRQWGTFAIVATCAVALPGCGSLISELERIRLKAEGSITGCSAPVIGGVNPVYGASADWLSYVRNDGASPLRATGTPCDGTEQGHHNSCLHGGELRQIKVTNRSACGNLTARDALGAFKWRCEMISGVPHVVTGGLEDGMLLSHLIDFSGAGKWRANSVTVGDTCGSASTPSSVWWTNNVVNIIVSVAPSVTLSTVKTIYLATAPLGKDISLAADNAAVVSQPGVLLTSGGGTDHISAAGKFQWLEVSTNSAGASLNSLNLSGASFCTLRGTRLAKRQLAFSNTDNCRIGYSTVFDAQLVFDAPVSGSDGNLFHDFTVANGRVYFVNTPNRNDVFVNLTLSAASYGFSTGNGSAHTNHIVLNHTGANVATGFRGNQFSDSSILNTLYVNSGWWGYTESGDRNTVINLAVANSVDGVEFAGTNNFISGLLKIGTSGTACQGSATAGIATGCTANQASNFVLTNTLNLATALTGKVTAESVNAHATGQAPYAAITDFFNFESRLRGWGRDSAAAPFAAGHRDSCTGAATCRIWDFRPLATDSQIRGVLPIPTGNDVFIHRWQATVATCAGIKDALWQNACDLPGRLDSASCIAASGTWAPRCYSLALRNAYEILGDAIGNDNGICESNEACIYTPNIGSYQGHGGLIYAGSVGSGGVNGVELYRYAANGL